MQTFTKLQKQLHRAQAQASKLQKRINTLHALLVRAQVQAMRKHAQAAC